MNLEEKAIEFEINNAFKNRKTKTVFKAGYNSCKSDLIEFLNANQKTTVKQVLEHLNQMK